MEKNNGDYTIVPTKNKSINKKIRIAIASAGLTASVGCSLFLLSDLYGQDNSKLRTITQAEVSEEELKNLATMFVNGGISIDSQSFDDDNFKFYSYIPNSQKLVSSGEYFYNELIAQDIKYCELLDEYYTLDGEDIAVVVKTETIDATIEAGDGKVKYSVPEGYHLQGTKGIKNTKSYVIAENGEFTLPEGTTLENIVEIIQTKPYSEIIDYNLVVNYNKKVTEEKFDTLYEGELSLIKK